jgi:hypothetical protein
MKQYPIIPYWNKGYFGEYCYAFEKLDGSNIRAEWSKKQGWHKFGTRGQMIDATDKLFGDAVILFLERYSQDLEKVFKDKYRDTRNFVVFMEYFGENSFAGWHDPKDTKEVVLFDVNQYKKGFIEAKEFIKNFGHLKIPDVVYEGSYNKELVHRIKASDMHEGVVCKGVRKKLVWMAKIKSNKWLDRLRNLKGEIALAKELNEDGELLADSLDI